MLRESQDNSCAICGIHESVIEHKNYRWNKLVIDHDHTTHKVRGLLCTHCNRLLGASRDNPEFLESAIAYLQKHR